MIPERNETTFLKTEEANGDTSLDNKQCGAMDNKLSGAMVIDNKQFGAIDNKQCGAIDNKQCGAMDNKLCGAMDNKQCGAIDNPQVHNMDAVNNTKAESMDISKDADHTEVKHSDRDKSPNNFEEVIKESGNIIGLEPSEMGLQGVLAAVQEALELIETLNSQITSRNNISWEDQQSINHKQSINHDQSIQLNRLHSNILQAIKNIKSLLVTNQEMNIKFEAVTADVGVQTEQFFGIKEEDGGIEESIKTENLTLSLDPNHLLDFNEDYSLIIERQLKGSDYLSDEQPPEDQPPKDQPPSGQPPSGEPPEEEQPLEEQYHSDIDYKPGLSPSMYGLNEIVPPKKRLRKKKKVCNKEAKTGSGEEKRPKRKKKARYHCHLCNRDLSCRKNFENHQLVAHSTAETKQECELCKKKVSVNYMERHIRNVHDKVKPHQCDECGKGFSQVEHLREHKLSHSGERPFKCDLCDKAYSMKAHLWTHKANHHRGEGEDSRVMCGHCGKLFRFSGLKKHESLCKENPDAEGRINEDGIKSPGMKEAMKRMCQKCGKWFSSALSLKSHESIHTGEKKLKCDICGEGFRHYNALYAHKDSHNPGTEYPCTICGKAFEHKENLRIHTYRHIKPRTFPCDVCGKTFNEKGNLKRHMNIHTGEKTYRCDQCGRNFAQPEGLKIHSVVHTGEKPYKCDACGKAFTQCSGLSGHRKRCHMKTSL